MSKRSSIGLSPDSSASPDDLFSNYLRELTMAPTQLKRHQNGKVNQQIYEKIKQHIQKSTNTSDPDKLLEYLAIYEKSINTSKIQDGDNLVNGLNGSEEKDSQGFQRKTSMSEFALMRRATIKKTLGSQPNLAKNKSIQSLIETPEDKKKAKLEEKKTQDDTIDYQKLAQQVKRLGQLHSFKIQQYNQNQQALKTMKHSITKPSAILEEDEGEGRDTDRKKSVKQLGASNRDEPGIKVFPPSSSSNRDMLNPLATGSRANSSLGFTVQYFALEPRSRKISLKKELKQKSLQKLQEYHQLKKKIDEKQDSQRQRSQVDSLKNSRKESVDTSEGEIHLSTKAREQSKQNSKNNSKQNSFRRISGDENYNLQFIMRKSVTAEMLEQQMSHGQQKDLMRNLSTFNPKANEKNKRLKVGDEEPDIGQIFRLTQQKLNQENRIKLLQSNTDTNLDFREGLRNHKKGNINGFQFQSAKQSDSISQNFQLNLKPVFKKAEPHQPEESKRFGQNLKQNIYNMMSKTHHAYLKQSQRSNQQLCPDYRGNQIMQTDEDNQRSDEERSNQDSSFSSSSHSDFDEGKLKDPEKRKKYQEIINQKKLQLFDDLLETVDARLRESIMVQQNLFSQPSSAGHQTGQNFFNKRNLSSAQESTMSPMHTTQASFFPFPMSPEMMKPRSQIKQQDSEEKKSKKYRIKTFKVEITRNQFNVANLPFVKYGPEILQDRNYQFHIIRDEMSILYDKFIEFKTQLCYKYSFQSTIIFQTMGRDTQKRFNIQLEELIGFIIKIIHIVLLKFGEDPSRIGLKDFSKILSQTVKVRNECLAFRDNQSLFIEMTDMFKKAFDAYYIMTKMLGFSQISYDQNNKLMQFLCRARLSCKELMQDFRSQEELLNREFQKEKMYIESMLMRGDDLYEYKYRQKLDPPEIGGKKGKEDDSYQFIHKFLEQQSIAYSKKLKKIQQDQQSKLQQLEKKKQEELLREKLDKELEDNPNLFLMDSKFMEAMEKQKVQEKKKNDKKKQKVANRNSKSMATLPTPSTNPLAALGLPLISEEPQKLKGKMKYKVDAKLQTQPQFTGKQALNLKLQIKEVMKNLRNIGGTKSSIKTKEQRQERRDSYEDMDANALGPPPQREPENYISNETREFIHKSINKNKMKSAGFLHPAQLEKMIYLEKKKNKEAQQMVVLHSKTELKALKEVEKAFRVGIQSCKEVNKIQQMSQSLRDIVYMSNPISIKKPKKRHPEARKEED